MWPHFSRANFGCDILQFSGSMQTFVSLSLSVVKMKVKNIFYRTTTAVLLKGRLERNERRCGVKLEFEGWADITIALIPGKTFAVQ